MQTPSDEIVLRLRDEEATAGLARLAAMQLAPGFILFLSGDLGAGKTTFTRALLRALGYEGRVRSPTFTLAESYNLSKFDLYHFDFYRFSSEEEWREAGFEAHVGGEDVAVIEWPELGGAGLPPPDLWVRLAPSEDDDGARIARLAAHTGRGRRCLSAIAQAVRSGEAGGVSSAAD